MKGFQTLICLLRGVNVGGSHKVRMESLRELCGQLGHRDAATYIQSGNVVFRTDNADARSVESELEAAMEKAFGFRPAVITRSLPDLKGVVKANPFADRADIEPNKLVVTFLAGDPDVAGFQAVAGSCSGPEEIRLIGRELFTYFPLGQGVSKLPFAKIDKSLRTTGTGRNWNTVLKLISMAEELAAEE